MRRATKASMFLFEVGNYKSISEIFLPVHMNSERKDKNHIMKEQMRNKEKEIKDYKV